MRARPPVSAAVRLRIALLCGAALSLMGCQAQPPARAFAVERDAGSASLQSLDPKSQPSACAADTSSDLDAERDAVARALVIDPDDPSTLADAAELYLVRLPASTARSEIGLLYARRGREQLERRRNAAAGKSRSKKKRAPGATQVGQASVEERELYARLLLLEGEALLDLGRARQAMERFELVLHDSRDAKLEAQAQYERGVAQFELCRLPDARRSFEDWLAHHVNEDSDTAAFAHHHLGLVLELVGEPAAAARELKIAERLRPDHFPAPLPIDLVEFRRIVETEAKGLPEASIADLKLVKLETAELPDLADLTLEEPPLSPTLLGLFRGLPLGEEPSEPRAIVLYLRNLLRVVGSREELASEVRVTLLHELGHLRGADDEDLRERGLE
jgi:predicted Zn-dependent protease with MMP-like domain